jgi:hypothetical protein
VALSYKSSLAEGWTTKIPFLVGAGIGISANIAFPSDLYAVATDSCLFRDAVAGT